MQEIYDTEQEQIERYKTEIDALTTLRNARGWQLIEVECRATMGLHTALVMRTRATGDNAPFLARAQGEYDQLRKVVGDEGDPDEPGFLPGMIDVLIAKRREVIRDMQAALATRAINHPGAVPPGKPGLDSGVEIVAGLHPERAPGGKLRV